MAGISGFPETIDVTLGTIWAGRNSLSSGNTITLSKVDAENWSEDGTNTFNATTNRLRLNFSHVTTRDFVEVYVEGFTGAWTVEVVFGLKTTQANNGTVYTFLDIFDDTQTNIDITHNWGYAYFNNFNAYASSYNSHMFSAIEDAAAGGFTLLPTAIASAEAFGTPTIANSPPPAPGGDVSKHSMLIVF